MATYLKIASQSEVFNLHQIEALEDDELKAIIFPDKLKASKPILDFEKISKELTRKNVTLMLLWEEELEKNPNLFSYNHFCYLYRKWAKESKISMKQNHQAGEKCLY